MKNEDEQKCNNNEASKPVETQSGSNVNDNQNSVENENTQK